ncbi:hypothetical protein BS78_02G306300 [Paspalum vaginatum]|nr:hypothetical protein BS78_02G306300 [Paspalum vaginatum]
MVCIKVVIVLCPIISMSFLVIMVLLFMQQRSATKVTFPLVWSNTCCSHPLYRDSELIQENSLGVRKAAQRKLLDELGVPAEDAPVDQFTPLGRMLYEAPFDEKWGEHEITYFLFIVRDVELQPNQTKSSMLKICSVVCVSPLFLCCVKYGSILWWDFFFME